MILFPIFVAQISSLKYKLYRSKFYDSAHSSEVTKATDLVNYSSLFFSNNRFIKMAKLQLLCLCFLALYAWNPVQGLAVMSVDFGNEWMKIAIVSVKQEHI